MVVADNMSSAFKMEPFSPYSASAYGYTPGPAASYLSSAPYHSMFSSASSLAASVVPVHYRLATF